MTKETRETTAAIESSPMVQPTLIVKAYKLGPYLFSSAVAKRIKDAAQAPRSPEHRLVHPKAISMSRTV